MNVRIRALTAIANENPGWSAFWLLVAAGTIVSYWPVFLAVGLIVVTITPFVMLHNDTKARHAELAARAEHQQESWLAGRSSGIFGIYPPATLGS